MRHARYGGAASVQKQWLPMSGTTRLLAVMMRSPGGSMTAGIFSNGTAPSQSWLPVQPGAGSQPFSADRRGRRAWTRWPMWPSRSAATRLWSISDHPVVAAATRRVRLHQRHQRLDRGRETGECRDPTLAVGARRAKRSPGSASGPAHSATRPQARRRVRPSGSAGRGHACSRVPPTRRHRSWPGCAGCRQTRARSRRRGHGGRTWAEAPCLPGRPGIRQRTGMRTVPAELTRAPHARATYQS